MERILQDNQLFLKATDVMAHALEKLMTLKLNQHLEDGVILTLGII